MRRARQVGYGDLSPTTWLGKVIATAGIASGMLWFASTPRPRSNRHTAPDSICSPPPRDAAVTVPVAIVGSTFQSEWDRRNVRVLADALQTELLENSEMSHDLCMPICRLEPRSRADAR